MDSDELRKIKQTIKNFQDSDTPTKANMAVFYDEDDTMLYAGIREEWPMIIATDIEWGMVDRRDATQPPFAGKKVKFFSPFPGN